MSWLWMQFAPTAMTLTRIAFLALGVGQAQANIPLSCTGSSPVRAPCGPPVLPVANPLRRWVRGRAIQRAANRLAGDQRLQHTVADGRRNQRVIEALGRTFTELVGPRAETEDPLLKTYVAYLMGWSHLLTLVTADLDTPRAGA
jgi:hypothetical protein